MCTLFLFICYPDFYNGGVLLQMKEEIIINNVFMTLLIIFQLLKSMPAHTCWTVLPARQPIPDSDTFISTEVAHKVLPVYRRMADQTLLRRMTHGGTQNKGCLNAMIWARCLKTSFMGLKRVQGSVTRAVCIFNEGATELINLMNRMYVDTSYVTLQHLSRKDDRRMSKADAATTVTARKHRKASAIQRRMNIREEDARDGHVYGAGLH